MSRYNLFGRRRFLQLQRKEYENVFDERRSN